MSCNCSLRISLLGDGCSICNPEFYSELLLEQREEVRIDFREELSFDSRVDLDWFDYEFDMVAEYFTHE